MHTKVGRWPPCPVLQRPTKPALQADSHSSIYRISRVYLGESMLQVRRKHALNWAKHGESCLVSTVMNTWNGRCACSYRPLRTWRTTVTRRFFGPIAQFFGPYQKNNRLVSDNYLLAIIVL